MQLTENDIAIIEQQTGLSVIDYTESEMDLIDFDSDDEDFINIFITKADLSGIISMLKAIRK